MIIRVSAFLLAVTILAGCAEMERNGLISTHRDSFVHESDTDPTDNISDPYWAKRINSEKAAVKEGFSPQKIVDLDIQMARMMPDAQAILTSQDQAKAQAWIQKYDVLNHQWMDAQTRYGTAGLAANSWSKGAWVQKGDADPCVALSGQDLCQSTTAKKYYVTGPEALREIKALLAEQQRQRERISN